MDYDEYLKSPHWIEIREKRKEIDNHKCVLCEAVDNLNVHHITYDRLGYERISDLITLCSNCHTKVHYLKKIYQPKLERAEQEYRFKASKNVTEIADDYVSDVSQILASEILDYFGGETLPKDFAQKACTLVRITGGYRNAGSINVGSAGTRCVNYYQAFSKLRKSQYYQSK